MQSVFEFISKVFNGVEVKAPCRTVKFLHFSLGKPCLHGTLFLYGNIVMPKHVLAQPLSVKKF